MVEKIPEVVEVVVATIRVGVEKAEVVLLL
jgi:hypothetical protein